MTLINIVNFSSLCRYFKTGSVFQNYADVLAILMRLRQLCCHPKLCAKAQALASSESKYYELFHNFSCNGFTM